MNIWHGADKQKIKSTQFDVLIEIPKGCKAKYEVDKSTGMLRLDRILYTSMVYPSNYGFIPCTLAEDGDPLDALVLCGESIYPMTLVSCMPIGVIKMLDGGKSDEKIIAVPVGDPTYKGYADINELPSHIFEEMMHFFDVYKALENESTSVKEVCGMEEAVATIQKCINLYDKNYR